jgi:hypothetical protein
VGLFDVALGVVGNFSREAQRSRSRGPIMGHGSARLWALRDRPVAFARLTLGTALGSLGASPSHHFTLVL